MNRFTIILFFLLISALSFGQVAKYSEVKVTLTGKTLVQLASLGIPVDEGNLTRDGALRIILSQEELAELSQAGFTWEVITDDYSQYITDRNAQMAPVIEAINREIKDGLLSGGSYPVPTGFELGTMGGFYKIEEIYAEMDSLHNEYPDLVSARAQFNSTLTEEGRAIYYIKISDNPNVNEDEPKVFYNSITHAREPMGMQQLFFFMNYLLEHYSTDTEIQYLLNNVELYFVPLMNPDGYHQNQMTNPIGGGNWRKNKRNNGDGTYGVDLNRNWGYMWGYDNNGSSPNTGDETYRGPAPFSEPETQIGRDFCDEKHFKLSLNYHTYSNLLLYPWSYITEQTPDSNIFMTYAEMLTRDNRYTTGLPGSVLYNTNGDINDWLYGETSLHPKAYTFTPEVGGEYDGFWPLPSRIIPLAQENMLANLLLAHLSYRYAEAYDESPVIIPDREGTLSFRIKRYGLDNQGTYTVSIQPLDTTVITSVGDPVSFTTLMLFTEKTDSISYTIAPDVLIGTEFKFLLQVNNGFYTHSDTITKYFGPPLIVFQDSCHSMSNWSTNLWNVTSSKYYSPPKSITDSPSGHYGNNANNSVVTENLIDLLDSPVAVIEYMAQWEIEKGYDYVQVLASSGVNFTPLAGKYTHPGTSNQAQGQPVYDGIRKTWVAEQIGTTDYVNEDIRIRFTLRSDAFTNADGFYFDDIRVTVIDMSGVGIDTPEADRAWLSEPMPNPSHGITSIRYRLPEEYRGPVWLKVYDIRGIEICSKKVETQSGIITLNTEDLGTGVCICRLEAPGITSPARKLLVID
jgi:carboxypeptidase T